MAMKDSYESRTRRVRRALVRRGLGFRLSPSKDRHSPEYGKFHIVDLESGEIVHGKRFSLTLEEIETFALE